MVGRHHVASIAVHVIDYSAFASPIEVATRLILSTFLFYWECRPEPVDYV